ncbi:hypothetical protein VNI00_006428 [Paramarasmius palmivorus]|uniref:Uncharacterized protein n=1 Tax=Paramarasmius palmivorus TaxID=297713 RepID=A0AAW0D7R8_9AGAR
MGSPTGCDTPQSNPATPTPRKHSTLFDGAEGLSNSAFNTPAKRSNQDAEMVQNHRSSGKIPKLEGRISSTSRGKGKERVIYTMEEASMSDDAVLDRMGLSLAGFDKGLNVGESDDCKHRSESSHRKPPTTHDFVFRDLSAKDLLNYSKVNRAARAAVKAFYRRALRVESVLSRYFNDDEIRRFRILQYTTGCLISGSTALSFFERKTFSGSDLDLYVDFRFAIHMTDFLVSSGFTYHPFESERKQQAKDLAGALEAMDNRIGTRIENETIEGFGEYIGTGIVDVFSFTRHGEKVQVIATGDAPSPLDVIFKFHSTVVMNIIGYSCAISFFPKATFIDRITVVNDITSPRSDQTIPRKKYEERGWRIKHDLDPVTVLNRDTALGVTDRFVGDRWCWTVPLPPVADFVPWSLGLGQNWMLMANSWTVRHRGGFSIRSTPFYIPSVVQAYAYSDKVINEVRKNPAFRFDDSDDTPGPIDMPLSVFAQRAAERAVVEDKQDAHVRTELLRAFGVAQEKYAEVELDKQITANQAAALLEYLQNLVKQLPELPKFIFRFAQDRRGHVWANVDVVLPLGCKAPKSGGNIIVYDRATEGYRTMDIEEYALQALRYQMINVVLKESA